MTHMDVSYRLGLVDESRERRARVLGANSQAVVDRIVGVPPRYAAKVAPPPPKPTAPPKAKIPHGALKSSTILAYVSVSFGVSVDNLLEKGRLRRTCMARFAAYWLIRELLGYSYPDTAYCLGRTDHTSSIHGVTRAIDLHLTNDKWRQRYQRARSACLLHQSGPVPISPDAGPDAPPVVPIPLAGGAPK